MLRELVKVTKIEGDVDIKATQLSDGSIILQILMAIASYEPFTQIHNYLNFLKVADPAAYTDLMTRLGQLREVHREINDLATEFPVDYDIVRGAVATGLSYVMIRLFHMVAKQKTGLTILDDEGREIPTVYAPRLKRLIRDKIFRKALKPFVEGEAAKIVISAEQNFRNTAEITDANFGNYLSEDEQILPQWENGAEVRITGKIVSLQCTRGESMKFKVTGVPRRHQLLMAYPTDGKTTQDFLEFYRQDVSIKAAIVRRSLYQKPTLIIKEIELVQNTLTDE